LRTNRKYDFEPYWQDEKDWLCIVEFLPTDNPEARLFAADIIGYLVGYANLTNTRSRALLGDPDASAYELLFSFSCPEEKNEFQALRRIPVCRPHGRTGRAGAGLNLTFGSPHSDSPRGGRRRSCGNHPWAMNVVCDSFNLVVDHIHTNC
jgi:hypothetical protein